MANTKRANFGPSFASSNVDDEKAMTMTPMDDNASDILALISRLAVTQPRTDASSARLERLLSQLTEERYRSIAKAMIEGDKDNPAAQDYLKWASRIRRGSNGSQAKRQRLALAD